MDELSHRVRMALHALKRNLDADFFQKKGSMVTGPQWYLLYTIAKLGECRLTHLAEKMEVRPSAITVMIDRLEAPGFVRRTHDTTDRRAILVEVTPEGKRELDEAIKIRGEELSRYLGRLDEKERVLIAELLEKMTTPIDIENNDSEQ